MMVDEKNKHEKKSSADNQRTCQGLGILLSLGALLMLFAGQQQQQQQQHQHPMISKATTQVKVLYIVTTLNEYDNGARNTVRGFDRLQETLIPVVRESVQSMVRSGFHVDVVLICHYKMTREHLIQKALRDVFPSKSSTSTSKSSSGSGSVGLQVWDTATPLGYKLEDKKHNYTQDITRALARQHRVVIKDKFPYYDMFVNFEDDMLLTGEAVQNYIDVTQELYDLRAMAPEENTQSKSQNSKENQKKQNDNFYGVLTKSQLQRMMPGLIRVEVLLDEAEYGAQEVLDPVPVTDRPQLDPGPCCHLSKNLGTVSPSRPEAPSSDQLFLWETNIRALGVRKMPLKKSYKTTKAKSKSTVLEWVLMQRGPRVLQRNLTIGDYWSGRDGYFETMEKKEDRFRPDTKSFGHINNQGGWMATRHQIWEWHTEICPGGFLPPYESPEYNLDGLDMRNVEYWSGGMSLFTKEHGCNLQRIIPLGPERFARSLIYHTANNKQRQLHGKRHVFVKANDLLGELNTVRKNAQAEMQRRLVAMSKALQQHP